MYSYKHLLWNFACIDVKWLLDPVLLFMLTCFVRWTGMSLGDYVKITRVKTNKSILKNEIVHCSFVISITIKWFNTYRVHKRSFLPQWNSCCHKICLYLHRYLLCNVYKHEFFLSYVVTKIVLCLLLLHKVLRIDSPLY